MIEKDKKKLIKGMKKYAKKISSSVDEARKLLFKTGMYNKNGRLKNMFMKEIDLSNEQIQYIRENPGMCPFCKDEENEYGIFSLIDQDEYLSGHTVYDLECESCGAKWHEEYTLTRAFKRN